MGFRWWASFSIRISWNQLGPIRSQTHNELYYLSHCDGTLGILYSGDLESGGPSGGRNPLNYTIHSPRNSLSKPNGFTASELRGIHKWARSVALPRAPNSCIVLYVCRDSVIHLDYLKTETMRVVPSKTASVTQQCVLCLVCFNLQPHYFVAGLISHQIHG